MKKFTLIIVSLFFLFLFNKTELTGQIVFNNSTPGTYSFVVAATTTYKIECWGGGGRGGPRANDNGGAGGAGGGAYSTSTLTLNPGTYTIKVGKGGLDPGNADGDTSYLRNGTFLVLAMGGQGVNANTATGGLGGQAAAGIGTTKYSGGNGANGTVTPAATLYGGGGGSSAGTGSNGNNGSTSTGGSAPVGGAKGGDGRTLTDGPGLPGNSPGGAGGGARKTVNGGGQQPGGLGSAGKVCISIACSPPTINQPATPLTVECDGAGNIAARNAWLTAHGNATANGGCAPLTWTNNFTAISDGCGATGSAIVTFTVTDANGSTATTTATFTIVDTTSPTIAPGASNGSAECDGSGNTAEFTAWLNSHGGASATDGCGGVAWSYFYVGFSDGCGATGSAVVTFTVSDECFNTATTSATFTIVDTTDPYWVDAPSDLTVECDGAGNEAEYAAWLASFNGDDACGSATVTNDANARSFSDECGGTGSITVTFTLTDECLNETTQSATFTIADTTPPDAVCQDVTVEFDQYGNVSIDADDIDNGSSDICGSVTIAIDTADFNCDDLGNNTVTLTVTDECGNTSTCTATVTVIVPVEWRCHDGEKVIFCHVPPNYPAQNIQEICVSMDAVTICNHLGHGDHFGECDGTEVGYQQVIDPTVMETRNDAVNTNGDQLVNKSAPSISGVLVQPNPFSTNIMLRFNLDKTENVVLKVFNNMGQEVTKLYTGQLEAGQHTFNFDGSNHSEGMYYFSLVVGTKVENVRMILER